jgi:hypothetical protein
VTLFDRQYNCLPEPEKSLTWTFLTIAMDPLVPGMLAVVYDLAWLGTGGTGGARELAYRAAFALENVSIVEVDFVITGVGTWFNDWIAAISDETANPFKPCPCDDF